MPEKVLVMLSCYNGEKYIAEQLDSILNQKCDASLSIAIRDDGSTDSTVRILRGYAARFPDRIELTEGTNIGINAGVFSLIDRAGSYDYYAFSDQDDVWLEDKLQTAIGRIRECGGGGPVLYASPSYLVHDDLIPFGTTRKQKRELTLCNTIIQNICPGHNQVMNLPLMDLLKSRKVDASRLYVYDSWIMNTAMLMGRIIFDPTPHVLYRQHAGNQFGTGKSALGRLWISARRAGQGAARKQREEIGYFASFYRKELSGSDLPEEIGRFLNAKGLWGRFAYILSGRLYRQSRLETLAFKMAYLMGFYGNDDEQTHGKR